MFLNVVAIASLFTLGKQERLKSRKQIEQLFKDGKRFGSFPFRIFYVCHQKTPEDLQPFPAQFGAGVSSRNFKRAVDRNRIKRLTREAYRLQKQELYHSLERQNRQLAVFFIFTAKEIPDQQTIHAKMALSLKQLIKELNGTQV